MYYAHNYLDDPSAKFWAVLVAYDREDAQKAKGEIWKQTQPEYGVSIDRANNLESMLWYLGIRSVDGRKPKSLELIPYLKELLPYCTDKLQDYLIGMMVRMSIDMRLGANLREMELRASESYS